MTRCFVAVRFGQKTSQGISIGHSAAVSTAVPSELLGVSSLFPSHTIIRQVIRSTEDVLYLRNRFLARRYSPHAEEDVSSHGVTLESAGSQP
jgi:hypothetical protein